jgi:UPF0176 protein
MRYFISSFYKFTPLTTEKLHSVKETLLPLGRELNIEGLILLSPEGYNATVAGSEAAIRSFVIRFREMVDSDGVILKESFSELRPFRRLKVDIRPEIITFHGKGAVSADSSTFLSPSEWHRVITEEPDIVLIDTRNFYEVGVGKFKNAVDPSLQHFTDFPDYVRQAEIPKEKKILLYCTGGIRCEKAVLEMQSQGYENVFQLHGGILKYLEEFPDGAFEGECFVFDHRVTVDRQLRPAGTHRFCPHCGNPAPTKISCDNCEKEAFVCIECQKLSGGRSCSKNCRYHLNLRQG